MYKKKLKVFVFGMMAMVTCSCFGVTYYNERPSKIETLNQEQFEKKIKIKEVNKDARFLVGDPKEKNGEYVYKLQSAVIEENYAHDLGSYSEFTVKDRLGQEPNIQGKIKGYEVVLPYNLYWVGNDSPTEILKNQSSLTEKSKVMVDTQISIPSLHIDEKNPYNKNNEKELTQSFYKDYKHKIEWNQKIQKKRQTLVSLISGSASALTCLIFYFVLFRKMFKKETLEEYNKNKETSDTNNDTNKTEESAADSQI